jgi:hypothetical protein
MEQERRGKPLGTIGYYTGGKWWNHRAGGTIDAIVEALQFSA